MWAFKYLREYYMSAKELRAQEALVNRSNALNHILINNEQRIADLETQLKAYQWGIAICGLIIGLAVL